MNHFIMNNLHVKFGSDWEKLMCCHGHVKMNAQVKYVSLEGQVSFFGGSADAATRSIIILSKLKGTIPQRKMLINKFV